MNAKDILIVPSANDSQFEESEIVTMLILKCPASLINSTKKFCVEMCPGSQDSALSIIPVATGHNNESHGFLYFSALTLNEPCMFSVLFDDGHIITKELKLDPDKLAYIWVLTEDDCEAFLLKRVSIIRAETESKTCVYDFNHQADYLKGLADLFQVLIERFLEEAAKHVNWIPKTDSISTHQAHNKVSFEESADYCYVYLMNDKATGYYKIGMSNNPEYRESTLQSEKPTIEKICHKKYPSRRVARAIESALHRVFNEKRFRGEWFKLNERDIWEIKQTLK